MGESCAQTQKGESSAQTAPPLWLLVVPLAAEPPVVASLVSDAEELSCTEGVFSVYLQAELGGSVQCDICTVQGKRKQVHAHTLHLLHCIDLL